ncbi:MAG: hypothetical protein JNK45_10215, partial [Myxococcales bacterium]|nr:hypothetical protein [Myxococcales bacterium]
MADTTAGEADAGEADEGDGPDAPLVPERGGPGPTAERRGALRMRDSLAVRIAA